MKLLLLFLCVNLSLCLLQRSGQREGVNLSPGLLRRSRQRGGVNLSSCLLRRRGQRGGANLSLCLLRRRGHRGGVSLSSGFSRRRGRQRGGVSTTVVEIQNMVNAIQTTPLIEIEGDSFNGECVYSQQDKRTRIEEMGFDLDLWSAVMCTFGVVVTQSPRQYARLYRPNRTVPGVNLQTLYLPLHGANTASFMTVPRTLSPTFFLTASLTGCDIFVATPGSGRGVTCPLVVIHTNACGDMTTDINHQEALAVLSVDHCRHEQYQIQYRVASSDHRSIIERGRYHYTTEYYNPEMRGIFFGYTLGGSSVASRQPWVFCFKNGLSTGVSCYNTPDQRLLWAHQRQL